MNHYIQCLGRTIVSDLSSKAYLYIEHSTADPLYPSKRLIEAELACDPRKLKNDCISHGYIFNNSSDNTPDYWKKASLKLNSATDSNILLSYRPGFVDRNYLDLGGKVIGQEKGQYGPLLHPSVSFLSVSNDQQGSLKEWQKHVADYAHNSPLLMLSICLPFTGIICSLTSIENGGFHIYGRSSLGKSIMTYVAASVLGHYSNNEKWNVTETGMEELSERNNDSLLILDDAQTIADTAKQRASRLQKAIYVFANGKGKVKAKRYQERTAEWRAFMLSNGEKSLQQYALEGGSEKLNGEKVRVIDIPAEISKQYGILESLPDKFQSTSEFVQHLESNCKRYFGIPKYHFLDSLIEDLNNGKANVVDFIAKRIAYFKKKINVDLNNGIEVRIADKFALVYAAGCLAIEYDVLPFGRKDILNGVIKCYRYSQGIPEHERRYKDILNNLKQQDYVDLLKNSGKYTEKDVKSFDVVRCKVNNQLVLAVSKKCLQQVCGDSDIKGFLKYLANQTVLLTQRDSSGTLKYTRQIRYKVKGAKVSKAIERRYFMLLEVK
ncbi:DUF927 domain-containing protein [Orbus wheelerorum]|uniref:DUF927 domain-containing protein n=1 Tax=Orbus wheelerorum TaxID=3074111 RepID=UPI00370D5541